VEFFLILSLAFALYLWKKNPFVSGGIICLGLFVLITGLFARPAYNGFKRFAGLIVWSVGAVTTWILLTPFFYIFFTIGRAIMVLRGKDTMNRKFLAKDMSYWADHEVREDPSRYRKQY